MLAFILNCILNNKKLKALSHNFVSRDPLVSILVFLVERTDRQVELVFSVTESRIVSRHISSHCATSWLFRH